MALSWHRLNTCTILKEVVDRMPRMALLYKSHHAFMVCLAFCLLCPQCLYADRLSTSLAHQRKAFIEAEKAINLGLVKKEKEIEHLKDYALYPYLSYQLFQKNLTKAKLSDFLKFQHRFRDFPMLPNLMGKWMEIQKQEKLWANLLALDIPKEHYSLRCLQAYAHLELNDYIAIRQVMELWEKAIPAPATCKPIFKAMHQQNMITEQLLMKRLEKTLREKPQSLKELQPFLSPVVYQLTSTYQNMHLQPTKILAKAPHLPKHKLRSIIISLAFKQLAKENMSQALQWWFTLRREARLGREELAYAEKELALQLAKQQKPQALEWLNQIPDRLMDDQTHEWRIRAALKQHRWSEIIKHAEHLPASLKQEPRWQYWLARSYTELGQVQKAKQIYQTIARQRNFYSFLASEALQLPHHLEQQQISFTAVELSKARQMPWLLRMQEFMSLGKFTQARAEWTHALTWMSEPQLLATAKILDQLGMHHLVINTLSKAQHKNDIQLRFPLAHLPDVARISKSHELHPAWIYAITRQESAFKIDARSTVGALGLMQLMPKTAQFIANKIRHSFNSPTDLYRADTNLKLGAAYLESLKKMMRGHPILATAAYNAGPARIYRWLPEQSLSADLWIETIPYAETREYVMNVLVYLSIYSHLLGQPTRLSEWMTPIINFKKE